MAYDQNTPQATETPAQSRPNIQGNFLQIATSYNTDHVPLSSGTNVGFSNKLTLVDQAAGPGSAASQVVTYSKAVTYPDASVTSEVFIQRDGVATEIQLTRKGVSALANGFSFLPGGLLIQWGTVTMTTALETFPFPTPFLNAVFCVQATVRAIGAFKAGCRGPGLASVQIDIESAGVGQVVYVMAIGN